MIVSILFLSLVFSLFFGITAEFDFIQNQYLYFLSFLFFLVLIVTKLSPIPKEILVSGYYTYGIFLPFSSFGEKDLMVLIFFLHVIANVLLTYNIDRVFDKSQKTFTLTQWIQPQKLNYFVFGLLGTGFCILLWMAIFQNLSVEYLLGMGLSYLWLVVCHFRGAQGFPFKSLCELSYIPMFVPQIFFFFSLLL